MSVNCLSMFSALCKLTYVYTLLHPHAKCTCTYLVAPCKGRDLKLVGCKFRERRQTGGVFSSKMGYYQWRWMDTY